MPYPLPENEKIRVQNYTDVIKSIKDSVLEKGDLPPHSFEDKELPGFERGITMAIRHIQFLIDCIEIN